MLVPARLALVAGLSLALSAPAALCESPLAALFKTVDATDPARLAEILRDEGYRAKVERDDVGDPKISSSSQGVDWTIFFYDCDGDRCKSIQFAIAFDTEDGVPLELVNRWNRDNRFAKAYLDDENDPFLEYDVNLVGGVTRNNFADTLGLWEGLLGNFMRHIDW
jgi:hypothetical protein